MEPRSLRLGRQHCLVWGRDSASPVLLIHGAGMFARWWEPLAPYLAHSRLIAPDLRGHGESAWAVPPAYAIEDFAADLLELCDAVEPRPMALAGHSMGGRVAAWLAAHRPERFTRLALLDTRLTGLDQERIDRWRGAGGSGRGPRRGYATRDGAEASFRITPDEPDVDPELRARLAHHAVHECAPGQWSLRFDRAALALEGSRIADLSPLLARIRCPTLIVRGEASGVLGAAGCEALAAALADARVAVVPGGHHFALAHPRRTGELLRAFLHDL